MPLTALRPSGLGEFCTRLRWVHPRAELLCPKTQMEGDFRRTRMTPSIPRWMSFKALVQGSSESRTRCTGDGGYSSSDIISLSAIISPSAIFLLPTPQSPYFLLLRRHLPKLIAWQLIHQRENGNIYTPRPSPTPSPSPSPISSPRPSLAVNVKWSLKALIIHVAVAISTFIFYFSARFDRCL